MRIKLLISNGLFSLLAACAEMEPPKTYNLSWEAIDGSHANGTMKVSARGRSNISYYWNYQQANNIAIQRCRSWNYQSAEAFGRTTKQCVSVYRDNSCAVWEYTRSYQCTTRMENKNSPTNQDIWSIKPQ